MEIEFNFFATQNFVHMLVLARRRIILAHSSETEEEGGGTAGTTSTSPMHTWGGSSSPTFLAQSFDAKTNFELYVADKIRQSKTLIMLLNVGVIDIEQKRMYLCKKCVYTCW